MLEGSATEIYPFIEYFGRRNTIFLVHYRNLLGRRYSFREALPDEGDMGFYRVLKALKDVGYSYGIDPDHVPHTADDPKGLLSVLCVLLRLHQCHDSGGLRSLLSVRRRSLRNGAVVRLSHLGVVTKQSLQTTRAN